MKPNLLNILIITLFLGFTSCDRPKCSNNNQIFENHAPNSNIYKSELAMQLQAIDQNDLTYWLKSFDEMEGKESLYFYIQGDGLCAVLHLTVKDWQKLEDVRERKGVGRRNAEFTNLQFDIVSDSVSTEFVYITFDRIID